MESNQGIWCKYRDDQQAESKKTDINGLNCLNHLQMDRTKNHKTTKQK